MISTAVLTTIRDEYREFEFTTEFDENGIIHLKHDNSNFLCEISRGEKVILWFSLLAVISKTVTGNIRFTLYRPFCRLDTLKRIHIAEFLKDNFDAGQVTIIDSKREFEAIVNM